MTNEVERQQAELEIKVECKKSVEVTLPDMNEPVTLSKEQLASWIKALGGAHQKMSQGEPIPRLEGQPIDGIYDTRWYIDHNLQTGASAISFHHPAYGPVAFLVPRDQVVKMVGLLSKHLEIQPEQPTAN